MKKIFTLASALLLAGSAFAQDVKFANPTYEYEGETYYVVQYDLEKGAFADANTFNVDETFVFAIDVTGSPLADALVSYNSDLDGQLGWGVAFDMYPTNLGEKKGATNLDGRLFKIKDNVYGMIFNMAQYAAGTNKVTFKNKPAEEGGECYTGMEEGFVTAFNDNVFMWAWNEKGTCGWWTEPIEGAFPFTSGAYDPAKKASPEFFFNEVVPATTQICTGLEAQNLSEAWDAAGYAYPTVEILNVALGNTDGISNVELNADVVAVNYFDLQGRKLSAAPANGLFIQQNVLSNGAVKAVKVVK